MKLIIRARHLALCPVLRGQLQRRLDGALGRPATAIRAVDLRSPGRRRTFAPVLAT